MLFNRPLLSQSWFPVHDFWCTTTNRLHTFDDLAVILYGFFKWKWNGIWNCFHIIILRMQLQLRNLNKCFVHTIWFFGLWYFGHFSWVIFILFFSSWLSCLAKCKQRYFRIFVTSSPKVTKNEKWDERNKSLET